MTVLRSQSALQLESTRLRSYTGNAGFFRFEVESLLSFWVWLAGLYTRFVAWLMRRMPNERQRLLAFTILAGGLCGLAAVAFHMSVAWVEG
ncbi:MAG: hypothetical protein WB679_18815, partial [Terracidiphilus sp.]